MTARLGIAFVMQQTLFGALGLELILVCVHTVWLQADGNVNTQNSKGVQG